MVICCLILVFVVVIYDPCKKTLGVCTIFSTILYILYRTQRPKKCLSLFFCCCCFVFAFIFVSAVQAQCTAAAVLICSPFQNLSFYIVLYVHWTIESNLEVILYLSTSMLSVSPEHEKCMKNCEKTVHKMKTKSK